MWTNLSHSVTAMIYSVKLSIFPDEMRAHVNFVKSIIYREFGVFSCISHAGCIAAGIG